MRTDLREIERHNAGVSMCMERICDQPPTHYDEIEYHGLKIFIALCGIHANKAMSTYSRCETCGAFDSFYDHLDTKRYYCNESGPITSSKDLINPGDKACSKYWNKELT